MPGSWLEGGWPFPSLRGCSAGTRGAATAPVSSWAVVRQRAPIAWGIILLTIFPTGPGLALLEKLWMPTAQLIPAIALTLAATSFITAATAGARAVGVARRSLRAQLTRRRTT